MSLRTDPDAVDWPALKGALAADDFDNGRTDHELAISFKRSFASVFARDDQAVVGTARVIADGVCNAYLLDVWTAASHRRQGIGASMVRALLDTVPGHHVALFTSDHTDFYRDLGFAEERVGMSLVAGKWLGRFDPPAP
ncbi:MAG TPA: GNAT family N-acetyltransferase [Egibacteraceae bacterium]|nr:GNAT family N-acetyltransferase [Egibacteraceae bacterium]